MKSLRLSRRLFLGSIATVGVGSTALLLSACQAAAPPSTQAPAAAPTQAPAAAPTQAPAATPAAKPAGPVKVTWWNNGANYERAKEGTLWPKMVKAVQDASPGLQIDTVDIPFDDIIPKTLAGLAAKDVGDVIDIHPVHAFTLAMRGALLPLNDYLKTIGFPPEDYTPAWQYNFWKGKYWALPRSDNPSIILYNRKLVTGAGLSDPYDLWKQGKWTIDEWDKVMAAMSKGEGTNRVFGTMPPSRSLRVQCVWIWGNDGDIWNSDETQTLIADDKAVKAWDYLASWTKNRFTPSPAEANVPGGWVTLYGQRRIAAIVTGAQYYIGSDTDFVPDEVQKESHLVPLNKLWNGKNQVRNATDSEGIYSGSKVRDAGWKAAAGMISEPVHQMILQARWSSPLRKSWLKSDIWLKSLRPDLEDADIWADSVNNVRYFSHVPRFPEIDKLVQTAQDSVVLGQKSAKQAMTEAKTQIDKILGEVADEVKKSPSLQ